MERFGEVLFYLAMASNSRETRSTVQLLRELKSNGIEAVGPAIKDLAERAIHFMDWYETAQRMDAQPNAQTHCVCGLDIPNPLQKEG